ncbi:MAG: DNA polymerase IV [Acidimicrobiales bacterium]
MSTEWRGPPPDGATGFVHLDMDAFFAAVEVRRRPELKGLPVVVGGAGDRGVVAAASYEARVHGIRSAMPSTRARRLCPHAVFLAGDHRHYAEVSQRVMSILREVTPLVEPLSLDEAFLDVRGCGRSVGSPATIAAELRRRIESREDLSCSVGVASNKFLAKLATDRAKPRVGPEGLTPGEGVHIVRAGEELAFLQPLPVAALWGVGPATAARLSRMGVETVGDLASLPESRVRAALGDAAGRHLHRLALGLDDRPVVVDRAPKSIGHEETFARDRHTRAALDRDLVRMADAVAGRLRVGGVRARTITLKVRFADFNTITRSTTPAEPTDSARTILAAAGDLLDGVDTTPGVRLLGVSGTGLVDASARQLSFDDVDDESWIEAETVIEAIRERFGDDSIGPAVPAGPDGIDLGRRGDAQWGPDR